MGQDLRVVQQCVINLQAHNTITSLQAQAFLKDFHENKESLDDVKKFHQSPELKYFLKYFIHNRYYDGSEIDSVEIEMGANKNCSSMEEEKNWDLYENLLKQYDHMKQKIAIVYRAITDGCLEGEKNLSKQKTKQVLLKVLGIENLQIIEKKQNHILCHDPNIDYTQIFSLGDQEFTQHHNVFVSRTEIFAFDPQTQKYSLWIHENMQGNERKREFICFFGQKNEEKLYERIGETWTDMKEFVGLMESLLDICVEEHYEYSHEKKLHIFSSGMVKILIFIIKTELKIIKTNLHFVLKQKFPEEAQIMDVLKFLQQENRGKIEKLEQIIQKLMKKQEEMVRQLEFMQIYEQNIREYRMILELDRFGKIKLCYGSGEHKIIAKIKDHWDPDVYKPIELFREYRQLSADFKNVMEGKLSSGVISSQYQQFLVNIYINKDRRLERVHFLNILNFKDIFDGVCDQDEEIDYSSEEQKEGKEMGRQKQNLTLNGEENYTKQEHVVREGAKKKGWVKLYNKTFKKDKILKSKSKTHNYLNNSIHNRLNGKSLLWNLQPMEGILTNQFDVLSLKDRDLDRMTLTILRSNNLFNLLVDQPESYANFERFIAELRFNYNVNKNSFHNYHHGVNVMHTSYLMLQQTKNDLYLSDLEKLSVLFSSLCHDVGHTGYNNTFEIQSFSTKALNYNDISPLENYHAFKTFDILRSENKNFLNKMDRKIFFAFKKNVIHNILNTDMKEHFYLLEQFKRWRNLGKEQAVDSISTLTSVIVHTSDFGGTTKGFLFSQEWSRRVNVEFAKQYERQLQLNLIPTPMMENVHDMGKWSTNELGFIKVIVLPLYKEAQAFYTPNNLYLTKMCQNLEKNLEQWKKLKEKFQNP